MVLSELVPNPEPRNASQQLRVYVIYAEEDEPFREQLARIMEPLSRRGLCAYTDRSQILAGATRADWLTTAQTTADVAVVLCSSALWTDKAAQAELHAVQAQGRARLVPIVVRAVDLALSPELGGLRALPLDARSVTESPHPDRTWQQIQAELKRLLLHTALTQRGPRQHASLYVPRLLWAVLAPYWRLLGALLVLGAVLGSFLLGEATLQARAELLGIDPDTFDYPWYRPFWDGAWVLPGVLWRIALLGGGTGAERSLGAVPVALFLLPLGLGRWPRLQRIALGLALVAALLGALSLVAVVRLHHVALDATGQAAQSHLAGGSLLDEAAFEVASWLRNGGSLNDKRRAALVGLYGLGWLTAWGLLVQSLRPGGWSARGLAVGFGLAALVLTTQAPRAYALGRWGLLYRPVLALAPSCREPLADALARGTCTAWDVSAGARPEVLLLRGGGCQTTENPKPAVLVLQTPGPGRCVQARGDGEPVLKGG